jgi:hypothetical protein
MDWEYLLLAVRKELTTVSHTADRCGATKLE